MSSNTEKIYTQYSGMGEDGRATSSRTASLEFYYTKKHIDESGYALDEPIRHSIQYST